MMPGANVHEAKSRDTDSHLGWDYQREDDREEDGDPVSVQWWHRADEGKSFMSRWFLNSRLGWEILKFLPFNIELHFRFNKSFVRISTQRWARCTQRWASYSPATGPARCPRPSKCFHRLPSLFIFKSCLFTWRRPAFRWRNPQFRNWEQLLYLTEPEKWSAAAMYQVFGYISQHSSLICSVLPFAVMISLDQNSWWF